MYKRFIAYFLVLALAFTAFLSNSATVSAFGMDDLKSGDRMKLGYSIINGYSKLSSRSGLTDYGKTAVYCGQDLSNPYLIALAGTFYFTNGVDLERTLTDNEYALDLVRRLNGFLKTMGVKNERAASLKAALSISSISWRNCAIPSVETLSSRMTRRESRSVRVGGVTCCIASLRASSGEQWHSTIRPSKPKSIACCAIGAMSSRRPPMWLGSVMSGRFG